MNQIKMDGKKIAEREKLKIAAEIEKIRDLYGETPTLATIIVGNDKASEIYVKMKVNACKSVGINSIKIELEENTTTEELLKVIEDLNNDEKVDGILLQHPAPKHIDERKCFDSIKTTKDVDGVNSVSFGKMCMGEEAYLSATPAGIISLLDEYNLDVSGMHAVVIGRSAILGKPVAMALLNKNATVTIVHSKTKNIENILKNADIVVACVGRPRFVKKQWLKKGCIIVDAGYNEGNVGDVEEKAYAISSAYTPVPGGVGPMTIAMLLKQTLISFKKRKNLDK